MAIPLSKPEKKQNPKNPTAAMQRPMFIFSTIRIRSTMIPNRPTVSRAHPRTPFAMLPAMTTRRLTASIAMEKARSPKKGAAGMFKIWEEN
jgi:hypothetical protein